MSRGKFFSLLFLGKIILDRFLCYLPDLIISWAGLCGCGTGQGRDGRRAEAVRLSLLVVERVGCVNCLHNL